MHRLVNRPLPLALVTALTAWACGDIPTETTGPLAPDVSEAPPPGKGGGNGGGGGGGGDGGGDAGTLVSFSGAISGGPTALDVVNNKKQLKFSGSMELTMSFDPAMLEASNCRDGAQAPLGTGNGTVAFLQASGPLAASFSSEAFDKRDNTYSGDVFQFIATVSGVDYRVQLHRYRDPFGVVTYDESGGTTTITSSSLAPGPDGVWATSDDGGQITILEPVFERCYVAAGFTQVVE